MSFLTKIDRKIWYALTIIVIAIPYVNPLLLPITIPSYARNVYQRIDALPEGSVVYWYGSFAGAQWGETMDLTQSMIEHIFSKPGIRIIFHALGDIGATTNVVNMAKEIAATPGKNPHGYEYGTDFIGFHIIPGQEVTIFSMFSEILSIIDIDMYEESLETMPLMNTPTSVRSYEDITMIIGNEAGSGMQMWIRVANYYDLDMIFAGPAITLPECLRYLGAGYVGAIGGMSGAAQYYSLRRQPSDMLITMDAMTTTHVVFLFAIVLGNITLILKTQNSKERDAS